MFVTNTQKTKTMEEKKRSVFANAMTYGLISGAVIIIYSLILFIAGQHMNKFLGWISYVILIGGMVYGTLEYRKKYQGGFMTFGQAFQSCFFIGLVAGVLGTIYMFFFVNYINPGFVNEVLEQAKTSMQDQNLTEDQMDAALQWTRKFTSPLLMTITSIVTYSIMSVVLGLIVALFLKKEDPAAKSTI
jgi:ABC-type antimicrobial peptide transport system permease subunit